MAYTEKSVVSITIATLKIMPYFSLLSFRLYILLSIYLLLSVSFNSQKFSHDLARLFSYIYYLGFRGLLSYYLSEYFLNPISTFLSI